MSFLTTAVGYTTTLVVLAILYRIAMFLKEFYASRIVIGKPNEWVVKIRGDKQVSANIGMSCYVGPFDQVAVFPANLNRVEFKME